MAYVTSSFPETSMVFEQNEVIGLVEAGVDVELLSCHSRHSKNLKGLHEFARPLVKRTRYFRKKDLARGVLAAIARPRRFSRVLARTLHGVVADPRRAFVHIGSLANALSFFGRGRKSGWQRVHANFSQGTATTAWYVATLLGVPFSFTAHAFDIYSDQRGARESTGFYGAKMAAADHVFTVSEHGRQRLISDYGEAMAPKISIQRVSVRLEDLDFSPYTSLNGDRKVIALGRLVEKKGLDDLIRAIGLLKRRSWPVECEIWGEGPEHETLVRLIEREQVGDLVTVRGRYRHEQLSEIFANAHALAVPSKMDSENDMDGVPTVIYEAMAAGCPIVASTISGIPEIVHHEDNGLLFPPGNVKALATGIEKLIVSRDEALDLAARARSYVEAQHAHRMLSEQLARRLLHP